MVGDGVFFVIFEGVYFVKFIKGIVKNLVGVGDFMVVGFIGEFVKLKDVVEVFKWGVVCGMVIIFLDDLVIVEFIKEIYEKVEVEKWWKFKIYWEKMLCCWICK